MADYENNQNGTDGGSGDNPFSYRDSYYHGSAAQQDDPVRQDAGEGQGAQTSWGNLDGAPNLGGNATNVNSGGYNPGGYNYVNYYSNPEDQPPRKPKKHTFLKAMAFVLAMVVVSAGSIGIYQGVRSMQENDSYLSAESGASEDSSGDESGADSSTGGSKTNAADESSSSSRAGTPSWIELASAGNTMTIAEIVSKVTPSVVGITATYTSSSSGSSGYPYYFFGFGNNNDNQDSSGATGVGTGIIMSQDGYIVTNAHVIYDEDYGYGEATSVQVTMSDEETVHDATIVAYDVETDLAVLKINATGLTAAEFGDSTALQVGDLVVAIGNPLGLEFQNTVTCGIVSALNRNVTINDRQMTLIQTDTAINSGNSGGPLINASGQVIGINSAKMSSSYSSNSASVEGMGFAIPMSEAKEIVNDLINNGYVTGRPQLGITCQDVTQTVSQAYGLPVGAYVVSVTDGGAASRAGIQVGDVITGIQDQEISTTEELNDIKNEYNAGDTITLTISRSGQTQQLQVTLQEVTSTSGQSQSETSAAE